MLEQLNQFCDKHISLGSSLEQKMHKHLGEETNHALKIHIPLESRLRLWV